MRTETDFPFARFPSLFASFSASKMFIQRRGVDFELIKKRATSEHSTHTLHISQVDNDGTHYGRASSLSADVSVSAYRSLCVCTIYLFHDNGPKLFFFLVFYQMLRLVRLYVLCSKNTLFLCVIPSLRLSRDFNFTCCLGAVVFFPENTEKKSSVLSLWWRFTWLFSPHNELEAHTAANQVYENKFISKNVSMKALSYTSGGFISLFRSSSETEKKLLPLCPEKVIINFHFLLHPLWYESPFTLLMLFLACTHL